MERTNSQLSCFQYLIAGPCAVESEEQVVETARRLWVQQTHFPIPLSFFRAGVWKPRSEADAFCGVGEKAFPWLQHISHDFGFQVCIEVANARHIELCAKYGIKAIWIGARTSVNPFIVQEIADAIHHSDFTVLVKNPIIPDVRLWLGNLERIEKAGIKKLLAVHRGFSDTTENIFRNAPMWDIPIALHLMRPDIPIICDPSHISGQRQYVKQLAQIAIDYGAMGLMIETHCNPCAALCDAAQQFTPEELSELLRSLTFKHSVSNTDDLLRQQRTLIHNIDHQLSQLLAKRFSIVKEIAHIKQEHDIPLLQPNQWNSVVQNYHQHTLQDDCYAKFLENFLDLLHHFSLEMQQNKKEL